MPTFTHGKKAKVFANGYNVSGYFNSVTVSGEFQITGGITRTVVS